MNLFDLIVCIVLVLAAWDGWRQGVVRQLCSLMGVVAGIWLASRYGDQVGRWLHAEQWLPVGESATGAVGFVVLLVATMLALSLLGILLSKIFRLVGFGMPDMLLGAIVSIVKYILLLSVLLSAFDKLNADHSLVKASTVQASRCYRPVMQISKQMLPFLHWVEEQIPEDK